MPVAQSCRIPATGAAHQRQASITTALCLIEVLGFTASWQGAVAPCQSIRLRLAIASWLRNTRHAVPGSTLCPASTLRQRTRLDHRAQWISTARAPRSAAAPLLLASAAHRLPKCCYRAQRAGIDHRTQCAYSVVMSGRQSFLGAYPTSPLSPG